MHSQAHKRGQRALGSSSCGKDTCKDESSCSYSPASFMCRRQQPQPEPSLAALAVEGTSLDGFMAKHTSEDNASFAEILEESNRRRRLSKPWLFQQQDRVSTLPSWQHLHYSFPVKCLSLSCRLLAYCTETAGVVACQSSVCLTHFGTEVAHASLTAAITADQS